jgi:hypothetical protein
VFEPVGSSAQSLSSFGASRFDPLLGQLIGCLLFISDTRLFKIGQPAIGVKAFISFEFESLLNDSKNQRSAMNGSAFRPT